VGAEKEGAEEKASEQEETSEPTTLLDLLFDKGFCLRMLFQPISAVSLFRSAKSTATSSKGNAPNLRRLRR